MADRYDDSERRRRDFEWGRRDWEQRLNRMHSYPPSYEIDPYRNFNRGIGDDRQWDRDFNRGQGYNRDWDQGEYGHRSISRGSLDRPGYDRYRDRDRERGGYNRGFDRDWESDITEESDWEPGTTWTYQETWWIVPGPFTGMGPSGYQRSDERILEDVNERLTQHGLVDASDISIAVSGGIVVLQGFVNSRREKRIAEDIAESVSGVADIENQLRVKAGNQGFTRLGGSQSRQIHEGTEVVDANGKHIGAVKEVRVDHFIVDRPVGHDLSFPSSAANFILGRLQLNVPADQVENLGRRTPERIETPAPRNERR